MVPTSKAHQTNFTHLQQAPLLITDGMGTGPLGHRRMWLVIQPMKYHLMRTQGSHFATYEKLLHHFLRYRPVYSRPLCALSSNPFNSTHVSQTFFNWWTTEPITFADNQCYMQQTSRWQTTTVLAAIVIWLSIEPTASTLVDGIIQPTTRRLHPVEGWQHDIPSLAYSCDHWHPPTSRWHRPRGHT
jgi:hypothetical protein